MTRPGDGEPAEAGVEHPDRAGSLVRHAWNARNASIAGPPALGAVEAEAAGVAEVVAHERLGGLHAACGRPRSAGRTSSTRWRRRRRRTPTGRSARPGRRWRATGRSNEAAAAGGEQRVVTLARVDQVGRVRGAGGTGRRCRRAGTTSGWRRRLERLEGARGRRRAAAGRPAVDRRGHDVERRPAPPWSPPRRSR